MSKVAKRPPLNAVIRGNSSEKTTKTNDGARIINSGKIYRQLFDSEVQLINALENFRKDKSHKLDIIFYNSNDKSEQKYKVLPSIQNQVSLLPENVSSNKNKSEVIPKILETRKLKFDKQLQEIDETIGLISEETSECMIEICRQLNIELTRMNDAIKAQVDELDGHDLLKVRRSEFNELQSCLDQHHTKQKVMIQDFYSEILIYESDRINKIRKYLSTSSFELERIGHVPPTDVHRLILMLTSELNNGILKNRESFCDIKTKLMMTGINEDRKHHTYIINKMMQWRQAISDSYLDSYRCKIEAEELTIQENTQEFVNSINPLLKQLSDKLESILQELVHDIAPENLTDENINTWNNSLADIKTEYDRLCGNFLSNFNNYMEKTYSEFLVESNSIKRELLEKLVYENEAEADSSVAQVTMQLLGSMHKKNEKMVNNFELDLNDSSSELGHQIHKVCQLIDCTAVLWRGHHRSLVSIQDSIELKLTKSRDNHQNSNLELENTLNTMIESMRQGPNETALKEALKKCLGVLDKIKASYQHFSTDQMTILKKYPMNVENEIKKFSEVLMNNFEQKVQLIEGSEVQEQPLATKSETEEQSLENNESIKESLENTPRNTVQFNFHQIDLPNTKLVQFWKDIQHFYSTYLTEWNTISLKKTSMYIDEKSEELETELQLRLNLHEPRQRRIECDVHNVRVTELSIHVERVGRQVRHVESMLTSIREKYTEMDEQQHAKQERYRDTFKSAMDTAAEITNQSKLQTLRRKLDAETTEYTKSLRNTLLEFRKDVDIHLQDIRKSNAQFICSFKLFSDGGNFCPEEIDTFCKRVEKVNQKIEETEDEIMSLLENVEKQQNDFVNSMKTGFEEKFKYHGVDIGFLDKLTRALAELQVQIKTEVANSNSQSQNIVERMKSLYTKIHAAQIASSNESSQPPSEFIDPDIYRDILALFSAIHDRSMYLDCLKPQNYQPPVSNETSASDQQLAMQQQTRVHFNAITALSKRGRQPNEDAGLKTVKEILKSQSTHITNSANLKIDKETGEKDPDGNTISNITSSRRTSIRSDSNAKNEKGGKSSTKIQIQDKKANLFSNNDSSDVITKCTFQGKIKFCCKSILDGVLYAADIYYKHKGGRKVTQAGLEDTLDLAADSIIARVRGYHQQTEDYLDECLREFNKQLEEIEKITNQFPGLVYNNMYSSTLCAIQELISNHETAFSQIFSGLSNQKESHTASLRPSLGHPNCSDHLQALVTQEEARQQLERDEADKYIQGRRELTEKVGLKFVKDITEITEELFLLMDNLLTTHGVLNAKSPPKSQNVSEVIRDRLNSSCIRGVVEFSLQYNKSTVGKGTWLTKDLKEIVQQCRKNDSGKVKQTEDKEGEFMLITSKSTVCHLTVMEQRVAKVEQFKKKFQGLMMETDELEKKIKLKTVNFNAYWNKSVKELAATHSDD